jgi:hypothetical protein
MYVGLIVNCLLLFSDFNQNLDVSRTFGEKSKVRSFTKIRQVVVALPLADGRFSQFCEGA